MDEPNCIRNRFDKSQVVSPASRVETAASRDVLLPRSLVDESDAGCHRNMDADVVLMPGNHCLRQGG